MFDSKERKVLNSNLLREDCSHFSNENFFPKQFVFLQNQWTFEWGLENEQTSDVANLLQIFGIEIYKGFYTVGENANRYGR